MKLAEAKKIIVFLIFLGLISLTPLVSWAADFSSSSFKVKDPVIDTGLKSSSSANFGLGQSLSQTAIGKSTSASYQLWSGFQYFFNVNANTLTATAGEGQVSLSWTVPQTFLGASVGGYEVGTGTVSGSYTFENAGNVTSYTKTGLSGGTTYYFKVKAKTAAGTFLVFSNEASATPTGGASSTAGGGGGSTILAGSIVIKGMASPNAEITILKDGAIAASSTADNQVNFNIGLTGLSSGPHSFGVYAVDRDGIKSATHNFMQNVGTGVTVTVDQIFLAPTIRASHLLVKKGEELTVSGFTVPDANIQIFLDSLLTGKTDSRPNGAWGNIIKTQDLEFGKHTIRVQAKKADKSSALSTIVEFEVGDRESIPIRLGQCGKSDLNCDGKVDLIDFSILLFYWLQPVSNKIRADIDKSGFVDLIDFSIMLYDWTG